MSAIKSIHPHKPPIKVCAITLGCPKNQVDTEVVLGRLQALKFKPVKDADDADWLVINTCAFIRTAEEETIQTILEAVRLKKRHHKNKLIVVGCLVKKYGQKKMLNLIPEIDLAVLPNELDELDNLIQPWLTTLPEPVLLSDCDRVLLSGKGSAYLKITEGCSRKCAFCLIPTLRGPLHSKPIDVIVTEAEQLIKQGTKELVVVAQDTASYGKELNPKSTLPMLLDRLVRIDKLQWLRVMYINPDSITEPLVQRIKREKKICPYLDMPIQHSSRSVLKNMKRTGSGKTWLDTIKMLREQIPGISLRTTILSGFPGETEEDHQELKTFIQKAAFDRLGVFSYSKETGTLAAQMSHQVHASTKKRRRCELMTIQEEISHQQLLAKVGQQVECLVEEPSGSDHVIARTIWDAPEVDGAIILKGKAEPGQLVTASITGATIHDLVGEII